MFQRWPTEIAPVQAGNTLTWKLTKLYILCIEQNKVLKKYIKI